MKKTTVYLPDELDAWLEQLARTKGTSKAELIREALRRYVETSGRLRALPPSVGSVKEDLGLPSDEVKRWLREHWAHDLEVSEP